MALTQAERAVAVITPLGEDVLLFRRMTATEALGRLFKIELDLLSKNANIKFEDLLGQNVTVRLELPQGQTRYFNGFIGRFSQEGAPGDLNVYKAHVHPWLWFLTRTADCRIFQDMKVPDIIKEVFRDSGFTDFEEALSGSYRTWEYCVQYRETDFNFVSRLMEQEGIYYYFEHENGKHTLVLSDSVSSHETFSGYEQVPYFPPEVHLDRERDHIYEWSVSQKVQPGAYALNDFDFKKPRANLQVKSAIPRDHAMATMEVYDYPGEYTQTGDGEAYARTRIEELQVEHEQVQGRSNARGLSVGKLFELTGFPRKDQNREHLLVSATHVVTSDAYETTRTQEAEEIYDSSFTALPSVQPYRPARITPKPVVQGPQTAVVVGPRGEEIYTDRFSRVKVQFHWDRNGKVDENSSCWIRVAQNWAGSKWGGIFIPRIGNEVIVDFLEGDPDRPIVTGRVYNNDNMPPYQLPANSTQSGIKTRSSKGASPNNLNEIRFEDKKGDEQIFIHAEKNKDIRIKNDLLEWVGNDSHLIVKNDQLEQVEGDKHLKVDGDHNEKVAGTVSLDAGMDMQEKVGMKHALDAGMEIHLKAGMNVVIEAGMSITLKAGGGFVVVGPAGVTISGTPVLINSGGSAGSGSGSSPEAPKTPLEADTPTPTEKAKLKEVSITPSEVPLTPQGQTFKAAAKSGTPFCEP